MSEPALSKRDRGQIIAAWIGWAVLAGVMAGIVASDPVSRSVTGNYRNASDLFWAGEPMYSAGRHGWLYLPNSALLYSAFTLGPRWFGEALYRVLITMLYAWGLWRVARMASPRGKGDYFPVMTLLAIPCAAGAIRNGQMNIPLGACMALAADALWRWRDWSAVAWLTLGLLTKPLGLVMMMLAGALRPRTLVPMGLLVVASLSLPFLKPEWGYVIEQYRAGIAKVLEAGDPGRDRFADVGGMLATMGIDVPADVLTVVRAAAAVGVLALSWVALRNSGADPIATWRRWFDRAGLVKRAVTGASAGVGTSAGGSSPQAPGEGQAHAHAQARAQGHNPTQAQALAWVLVLGLASGYLMLFNPRTEGVSYPILMPALTAVACWTLFSCKAVGRGMLLIGLGVVMGVAHAFFKGGDTLLRPLGTAVFMGVLVWEVVRGSRASRA